MQHSGLGMSNSIAIRTKPIFGRKRRPARAWALPMLLAIPLLAAALYFGNEAPVTPALANAPQISCKDSVSLRRLAGHGPADMAPEACRS